jgi:hypothetical protein
MAFSSTGFNTIAANKSGNAPSIFSYRSTDTQATMNTAGYFNEVTSLVKVGDIIFLYDATTPSLVLTYVNQNTTAGVVDIADGTTISATDTD